MGISAEKIKLMTNMLLASKGRSRFNVKGQKRETAGSFMYFGAIVSDEGSELLILSRFAQATAALTKLKPI